ncbi:MAG: histidine kinase [Cyclobacteriaceae bacterium]|nr:histidine kinase [Cyclobacteriaceae bacterium]
MAIDRKIVQHELRDLGLFVLISLIQPLLTCPRCNTVVNYALVSFFTFFMWVFLWKGNALLSHYLNGLISWIKFPVQRLAVGIITTILYTASIIYCLMIFFEFAFAFNFGQGFRWTIYGSVVITILISTFLHAREFFLFWRKASVEAERHQKESVVAKFESLKNQVNPHFLFNSLNALTNLVYEDQEKAVKFIKQLSEVYRYVLDSQDKEVVSIEEEKKFLRAYVYLQQIRFGDKLRLDIQLDDVQGEVAPLVLQMLVENAIKHNVISEEYPLSIYIYLEGDYLVVENNLQKKMILHEESPGIGLENIRKRYEFLTEKKVWIEQDEKFVVKLPLIKAE